MSKKIRKARKLGQRLKYKIRHHKGHGIHSPFVFNLVNNVIEEKRQFYCYNKIKKHLRTFDFPNLKASKIDFLCFRLANYMNPTSILELGSGKGITTLFLSAYNSKCICYCYESNSENVQIAKTLHKDMYRNIVFLNNLKDISNLAASKGIFVNLEQLENDDKEQILDFLLHNSKPDFIVVKGIRKNKDNNHFWERIGKHAGRTALLDLFHHGILFFNPSLSRYNYQISF